MSLHLDFSPQAEARFAAAAQQNGIEPAALFERMVSDYLPAVESTSATDKVPSAHFYFTGSTEQIS